MLYIVTWEVEYITTTYFLFNYFTFIFFTLVSRKIKVFVGIKGFFFPNLARSRTRFGLQLFVSLYVLLP